MSVTIWDGSAEHEDYDVKFYDGTTERSATVEVMPYGYHSVNHMLASGEFYIAHRGGSVSDAEGSLRAYTNAVKHGYGALEISLARTIDGVWFGLHDQTLNRTSQVTGLPDIREMTWAQVQNYVITNGPKGHEQYMRWDELLEAGYQDTHVLFLDPKHAQLSSREEFFDQIVGPLDPDRVVIKYAGGNLDLAAAAAARGYPTWGYFYEPDVLDGRVNIWQAGWTFLGFDYGASEASWDVMLGFGKPVIGHVCPNQLAADMALGYGAAGVMVSGTAGVTPTTP